MNIALEWYLKYAAANGGRSSFAEVGSHPKGSSFAEVGSHPQSN
jgi:hypothetical protein